MSTRKKVGISDLLRDEVQKGSEPPVVFETAEKTVEVKAETVSEEVSTASNFPITNKSQDVPDRSKAPTPSLESGLAQKRETELLQTIADLQKDLQFSHTNIELLQKSLAAIETLKNELDSQLVEVKRDNLRLAEANIRLSEQVNSFEAAKASAVVAPAVEPPTSSQLVSRNSPDSQNPQGNRATPRKQPVEQPYPQRDRNLYARPTGSNEQLQRVNNKNIGWMD